MRISLVLIHVLCLTASYVVLARLRFVLARLRFVLAGLRFVLARLRLVLAHLSSPGSTVNRQYYVENSSPFVTTRYTVQQYSYNYEFTTNETANGKIIYQRRLSCEPLLEN